MRSSEASEILGDCNHTELYQTCRTVGLPAAAEMSRDQLIDLLLEGLGGGENALDPLRDAIMAFLLDHWELVRSQLGCPARSGDPKSCYQCTDPQVLYCLVDNADEEYHIRQHIQTRKT
jgi:hypothetical protein